MEEAIHLLRHQINQSSRRLDAKRIELERAQEVVLELSEEITKLKITIGSLTSGLAKLESK